jgi:hypothetical protein
MARALFFKDRAGAEAYWIARVLRGGRLTAGTRSPTRNKVMDQRRAGSKSSILRAMRSADTGAQP